MPEAESGITIAAVGHLALSVPDLVPVLERSCLAKIERTVRDWMLRDE